MAKHFFKTENSIGHYELNNNEDLTNNEPKVEPLFPTGFGVQPFAIEKPSLEQITSAMQFADESQCEKPEINNDIEPLMLNKNL